MTDERTIEQQRLIANSYMSHYSLERERNLGASASTFYGGLRDIYAVSGYPTALDINDYFGRYQRDALAYRIITAAPDDTWRKPFVMLDGETEEDAVIDSEFVKAWNKLVQFDTLDGDLLDDSRRSLWQSFYEADKQAGIGQYAVMVLGFGDNQQLEMPLRKSGGRKLLYVNVLSEYHAKVQTGDLVKDSNSPRFGLPEFYQINYGANVGNLKVHHSRVIHVAEGGILYGKPRLEAVYNRLIDIEKLLSASGEAGWRAITRKIIISGRDGYQLSEGTVTVDKVSDMIHGLRDVVELEGADVNVVSGESIDPTGALTQQLSMVSAGTDIPVRILIGSERGGLASSQDEKHWNDNIEARRKNFVNDFVRQFIKRMIYAGLLPVPASGSYVLQWPSLYETDDATQSQTFTTYANGLAQLTTDGIDRIVKPTEFVKFFVRGLPADAVPTKQEIAQLEQVAMERQQQQMEMMAEQAETQKTKGDESKPPLKKSEPAINSYSVNEQRAIFAAAERILANE
jgi:hypothetical protein